MSLPPICRFYDGDNYKTDESVGYLMRTVVMLLGREIDEQMAAHQLTDAQWRPLFMIMQGNGRTAAEVARALQMDTGATTRLLDRLEAKGLLRRSRSHRDRRVVNLELTKDGEACIADVPHLLADLQNRALAGFSNDEVVELKSYLRRIVANARRIREQGLQQAA